MLESRCPSYGEGALYPLRGALLRFARIDAGASRETAHRRLAELVGEGEELLLRVLAAFLGLTEHPADIRDAAWAIRRLCERLSAERPLVVMIDDVHWADPTLLELACELSAGREHPVLVLALSRPDLIEDEDRAAVFGSPKTIRLTALRDQDQDQIARQVLGEDPPSALAERLRERAAGNPLFLEELLRSLTERGLLDRNGDGDGVAADDLSELGSPTQSRRYWQRASSRWHSWSGRLWRRRRLPRTRSGPARLQPYSPSEPKPESSPRSSA